MLLLDAGVQDASIPLATAISAVSAVATVLLGLIVALVKYNFDSRERELVRQLNEVREDVGKSQAEMEGAAKGYTARTLEYLERLHQSEIRSIRLEGDVKLVQQNADQHVEELDEIRKTMVTREVFEARTGGILDLLRRIEGSARRTTSESSMPATRPPRPGGG